MKTQLTLLIPAFLTATMVLAFGCVDTAGDREADGIRELTEEEANNIRVETQEKADDLREADGKTPFGNAETDAVETQADAIEADGERRADELEDEFE